MYSCLKIREPLSGFLSVPLQGKCTICKSKIHHPKSLVLNGAFREDEGRGLMHGASGDEGGPVARVAGLGGPAVGVSEAQLDLLQPGLRVGQGGPDSPSAPPPAVSHASFPERCSELSKAERWDSCPPCPAHRPNILPETNSILEFITISSINKELHFLLCCSGA